MSDIDIMAAVSQVGFPIAVSVFLLWKGYTQDQAYIQVLTELKTEILEIRKRMEAR